ncbi:hypothetical protein ES703_125802 [subsurface metagenome]
MGTVPTGIVDCSSIFCRIARISPPVERSIIVSAPASMATWSLSSSSETSAKSFDVPMFALTLVRRSLPIPQILTCGRPSALRCRLQQIATYPAATCLRSVSTGIFSSAAIFSISGVITPFRACSSCVMFFLSPVFFLFRREAPQSHPCAGCGPYPEVMMRLLSSLCECV